MEPLAATGSLRVTNLASSLAVTVSVALLIVAVLGTQAIATAPVNKAAPVLKADFAAARERIAKARPSLTDEQVYALIQECKSVITSPSGGQRLLQKGFYNITGLAWSGRGAIKRVDVSVDGGRNWKTARLESPVLPKCLTRFNIDWDWDGKPCILQSRAIDETGYVQPKIGELRAVRGTRSVYHNNAIQSWQVSSAGEVMNVQVS